MHLTNLGFEPRTGWFLIMSFTTTLSEVLTISVWNMHKHVSIQNIMITSKHVEPTEQSLFFEKPLNQNPFKNPFDFSINHHQNRNPL